MAESLHSSAKRKRDQPWSQGIALHPLKFSFDASITRDPEDGSSSPRTKVAHRFRGLDLREGDASLGGGGGVSLQDNDDEPDQVTKRQRQDEPMNDLDEPPRVVSDLTTAVAGDAMGNTDESGRTVPQPSDAEDETLGQECQNPTQDVDIVPDTHSPKSTARRRSGTPPLRVKKVQSKSDDNDTDIVDPVRASLTWHDDEITIYDPEDKDDDGTGLNGVGFKPTTAIANARVLKRRQQMAEYKRREESEARARRNQRRRGALVSHHASPASQTSPERRASDGKPDKSPRKVRFNDVGSSPRGIMTK